ncbi:MAG: AMP-binding protein, partial [Candidatus Obscuribacterales bacterium]|nr:AMP-binding protein [Candidatus Obscuribacterales bacterium]
MNTVLSPSPSANIAELLEEHAQSTPHRAAFYQVKGKRVVATTYFELAEIVSAKAARFKQRGIGSGDTVLILESMSSNLYSTILAILRVGARA